MKKAEIVFAIGFFLFSFLGIGSVVIASPAGAKQSQDGIASSAPSGPPRNDIILKDIACKNGEAYSAVSLSTTQPIFCIDYKLSDPANIIIDPQQDLYTNLEKTFTFKDGLVDKVMLVEGKGIAPPSLGTTYYPVDFIVVKLKKAAPYRLSQDGNMLHARFGKLPQEFKIKVEASVPAKVEVQAAEAKNVPKELRVKEIAHVEIASSSRQGGTPRNDMPPQPPSPPAPQHFILENLICDNAADASSIKLFGNKQADYFVTFRKEIPAKIVIDTIEPIFSKLPPEVKLEKEGVARRVRLVLSEAKVKVPSELKDYKAYDFIIVELAKEVPHSVSQARNELMVDIGTVRKAEVPEQRISEPRIQVEAAVPAEPTVQPVEAKDVPDKYKLDVRMPKQQEIPALLEMTPKGLSPQGTVPVSEEPKEEIASPAVGGVAMTPAPSPEPQAPKPANLLIEKITWKNEEKAAAVYITTNKETEFALYRLENPARVIVEPLDTAYTKLDREYSFDKGTMRAIKFVPKGVPIPADFSMAYYSVDFLMIQLGSSKPHAAFQDEGKLTIVLGEKEDAMSLYDKEAFRGYLAGDEFVPVKEKEVEQGLSPKGSAKPPREGTVPVPEEVEVEAEVKEKESTLDRCIETAIGNHKPAQIAKQEVDLAKMKVREALRAMFVTPTIKATKTRGIAGQAGFSEKKFGVSVEQPIYYNNRLFNTYRQSKMNVKVAKKRYNKAVSDLSYRIEQLYYGAVTARHNLKVQMALQNEAKSILESARNIFEKELTTQLEYLSVESQYSQINYQVATLQRDVQLAELNLKQAMGLEPGVPLELEDALEYKEIKIDPDESLELAFANRPELLINRDLVKVGEYEKKIALAKQGFKVDFTGFFGKSGSRSMPDELAIENLDHEISLGLQASKQWGGNTASYSFLRDKVSVKPGQSTRTFSETHNADFAILNALQGYSETKSANISYERALNDLIEIERTIHFEVREAYFNMEKAKVQINNYLDKIEIRKKELKIAQMQAGFAEAQLSQVIDAKVKLADEIVAYNQTVSSYYTAIASLNKAIGLSRHYK